MEIVSLSPLLRDLLEQFDDPFYGRRGNVLES